MLCIINCQYTHNQGKFCQNFQFFHIYTSFSVNLHHFTVTKPKFQSKSPKFRSTKPKFRSECNEISFFKFKIPFRSKLPKFREISPEIPFPPDGGIRCKNEKENPVRDWRWGCVIRCYLGLIFVFFSFLLIAYNNWNILYGTAIFLQPDGTPSQS